MNADFSEEEAAHIWVELEVQEDDEGLNCYCGLVEQAHFEQLVGGDADGPLRFLRLEHVFWTRTRKDADWEEERRQVVELGRGRWGNHKGSMYFRVDNIILISPLHGGAELQRRYVNKQ